jgi:hypothetical protein
MEYMSFMNMLVIANSSPPPVVVTANITIKLTKMLPIFPNDIVATNGATSPIQYI